MPQKRINGKDYIVTMTASGGNGLSGTIPAGGTVEVILDPLVLPALLTFLTASGQVQIRTMAGAMPFTPTYDTQGTIAGTQIILTIGATPYSIIFTGAVGEQWGIS